MTSDRYLGFVRRLSLLAPVLVGCSPPPPPVAPAPEPVAPSPPPTSSAVSKGATNDDPGSPCRCAWATDVAAAKRVCADGAIDHTGNACVRGADHSPTNDKSYVPVGGPLAPPELPAWSGIA